MHARHATELPDQPCCDDRANAAQLDQRCLARLYPLRERGFDG